MPADIYVVRFAKDAEGREVNHESFLSTAQVPYPPHRFAAMSVAVMPDDTKQMIGIALHPDATVDAAAYREHLSHMREVVEATAALNFPDYLELGLVWFIQEKASQMTDEEVDAPHVVRGVLYRPATDAEMAEWGGADIVAGAEDVEVHYGGHDG